MQSLSKRRKHPNSLLWQSRRTSSESVHAPTVYEYSSTKRAWRLTTSDIFKSKRAIVRQEQSATLTWYAKRHNTTNDTMMVSRRVANPPLLLSSNQDEGQPQVSFRYCRHVVKITRQQQNRAVHFHIVPHVAKSYYLMMGVATAGSNGCCFVAWPPPTKQHKRHLCLAWEERLQTGKKTCWNTTALQTEGGVSTHNIRNGIYFFLIQ
jgi:hypothetical protein